VLADALYCETSLNMGCPARTVANKGGGAALIRMPETAKQIIRAAQQGVRDWASRQTLEDLEMDSQRIERIRQLNEDRVRVWGDNVQTERRLLPVSVKTRLSHFPGAKHVGSELVRINSLADVERIIYSASDNPDAFKDEAMESPL
jgi:Dihydrouridine synthase (Dus)